MLFLVKINFFECFIEGFDGFFNLCGVTGFLFDELVFRVGEEFDEGLGVKDSFFEAVGEAVE